MSDRILTLFGDDMLPEQPRPAPRAKAKKKKDEDDTGVESGADLPFTDVAAPQPVPESDGLLVAVATETAPDAPAEFAQTEAVLADVVVEIVAPQEEEAPAPDVVETATETIAKGSKNGGKADKEDQPLTNLSEDWNGEKNYYTIGEVAELFKVKTSNIRFWTNEFNLKVRTTRKGDRLYTPAQVKELRAIYHLVKERKFTLSGAKARLKSNHGKEVETIDLKKSLLELRGKLVSLKNQISKA